MFKKITLIAGAMLAVLTSPVFAGPNVEMQTSMGNIVIELNAEKAPKTV